MHTEQDAHSEPMTQADYQRIIDELESVISEAKALMTYFEATDMDEALPDDYFALHELYSRMVGEQQRYTQAMLAAESANSIAGGCSTIAGFPRIEEV